jgi:2'-5' RNA ligase
VIWGGVEDEGGALAALAAGLGLALGPLGFPPDGRPFSPHFTFGRARDARGATGLGGAIAGAAALDPVAWRAEDLVLFRSHLGPGGSRYEAVARYRLGAP